MPPSIGFNSATRKRKQCKGTINFPLYDNNNYSPFIDENGFIVPTIKYLGRGEEQDDNIQRLPCLKFGLDKNTWKYYGTGAHDFLYDRYPY
jgi:hypothetical protein